MAVGKKPVTIHYRRFDNSFMSDGRTLEELVHSAMNSIVDGAKIRARFTSRLQVLGEHNYFVNFFEEKSGQVDIAFGDILHFTEGHMQALFRKVSNDAEKVEVRQMPAPEKAEYVHSQMFWMIKGNHAFVLQSQSLKTKDLEDYLSWLLQKKTRVLQSDVPIVLASQFDQSVIGGDIGDIQEIIIGGVATKPANEPDLRKESEIINKESTITQENNLDLRNVAGWDTARKILVELLGSDARVDSLLNAVPQDVDLRVQVHIGYQTKKKKIDRVALKQIETGIRNMPDSQIQIKSKGQSRGFDGTIRLHHNANIDLIRVQERSGTLLDPVDVQRAMVEAYSIFVSNGKISP
ncbi:hypothetical protein [Comamonas sp. CMM02]|uniref:hypothetical protein n=1 Tax=Comamonas sp. CMM02 TaxID=2769307 RepID=UPI001783E797|nr:hypothetical protein [Comamonas sp. CMM02]MBD9402102.1 hypothetical protein [Comamonas sp. CMM02]